ncbi:UNVERIFIED_CONTAM: hypothetical protein RMT77_017699 [Armadillidium vulgare]
MMNHARVFKKTAPNGKITVYVEKRELMISENGIEPLYGVLFVDATYIKDRKVYGQFVLTFRYGREDEEVMGLRFCNEACLQACVLWPLSEDQKKALHTLTPLQDTLLKRLGTGAVAFCFSISALAPPSVTLLPARTYMGAPIGTNYDIRIFVGESSDDKPHKRSSIRMGIKLAQISTFAPALQPYAANSRQLLLTDGKVSVEATLDKEIYQREEPVSVTITINNNSSRNVKKIKVLVIQFVDVAMFSNGKFKNVVASLESTEGCPVLPGKCLTKSFQLSPARGTIKNWIALEEFYDRESTLASSVVKPSNGERNVFAIYVNYYVKVKLLTSALGGEVCVKVPFKIMRIHNPSDSQNNEHHQCSRRAMRRLPSNIASPITSSQSLCDLRSSTLAEFQLRKISKKKMMLSRSSSEDTGKERVKSEPSPNAEDILKRLKTFSQNPGHGTGNNSKVEKTTVEVITHPESSLKTNSNNCDPFNNDCDDKNNKNNEEDCKPGVSGTRRKESSIKIFQNEDNKSEKELDLMFQS